VHRLPEPFRELEQLCRSGPFRLFCESKLPDEHQRLVCHACGLSQSGARTQGSCSACSRGASSRDSWGSTSSELEHIIRELPIDVRAQFHEVPDHLIPYAWEET